MNQHLHDVNLKKRVGLTLQKQDIWELGSRKAVCCVATGLNRHCNRVVQCCVRFVSYRIQRNLEKKTNNDVSNRDRLLLCAQLMSTKQTTTEIQHRCALKLTNSSNFAGSTSRLHCTRIFIEKVQHGLASPVHLEYPCLG